MYAMLLKIGIVFKWTPLFCAEAAPEWLSLEGSDDQTLSPVVSPVIQLYNKQVSSTPSSPTCGNINPADRFQFKKVFKKRSV